MKNEWRFSSTWCRGGKSIWNRMCVPWKTFLRWLCCLSQNCIAFMNCVCLGIICIEYVIWEYHILILKNIFIGNLWNLTSLNLSPCLLTLYSQHWNNFFVLKFPVYPWMESIFRIIGVLSLLTNYARNQEQADFFYECLLIVYNISDECLIGEKLGP